MANTGLHRKAAIRLLNRLTKLPGRKKSGCPRLYGLEVVAVLKVAWEATDRVCSRRLQPFLPELLGLFEKGCIYAKVIRRRYCLVVDSERINIVNALKRSEVFLGLEDEHLERIASLPSSREKTLQSGEVLFQTGERADNLYVLKEGRVDLVAGVSPEAELGKQTLVVDIVTMGGVLGWSALVAPHYYFLSAIAAAPSVVVCISGSELMALSDKDYYVGYRVFNGLARIIGSRLRDYEQVLLRGRRWPFVNSNNKSI